MVNKRAHNSSEEPLASIIVITYNSAKYVLETLESAKAQTYRHIELIVSDDYSTDDTVYICRKWLAENSERFDRTVLITVDKNTGIPANCNRGIKAAKGEWIKLIAGDDTLLPACIQDNTNYVTTNPEIKIIQSIADVYSDTFSRGNIHSQLNLSAALNYSERLTAQDQYQILLRKCYVAAPTVYSKKEVIESVGGFDENFKLLEDYPLWLKITKAGIKIDFMDKVTVKYRLHDGAISKTSNCLIHKTYFDNEIFRRIYIYPNLPVYDKVSARYDYLVRVLVDKIGFNRKGNFTEFIYAILAKHLNPFRYILYLKKILNKEKETDKFRE